MLMMVMDAPTAQAARELDGGLYALDPREIAAGPHADSFALPADLADDPRYSFAADLFAGCDRVEIDPAEAWPGDQE